MRLLFALLAAAGIAGLTGCVAYGGGVAYENGYYEPAYGTYGTYSYYDRGPYYHNNHDRDRDGIPNRMDRDRDGDGVPNRLDNAPNNPRRY